MAGPLKISIVTPSFNQAEFLDQTIQSVLNQNYPHLEYIIMDGGSTDGSVDIIKKYAQRLAYWCSEPDQGQYDAINKGFRHATGRVMAWINADDMYFPWTLRTIAEVFSSFPDTSWVSSLLPACWNKEGTVYNVIQRLGFSRLFFHRGYYASPRYFFRHHIQQESTFWTRDLWESAGNGLNLRYGLAADFDLWGRFFSKAPLVGIGAMLGGFRHHGNQRSLRESNSYLDEVEQSFREAGGKHCRGLGAWVRESRLPARWPLRILPSLGFVQPVVNIRWSKAEQRWIRRTDFIT